MVRNPVSVVIRGNISVHILLSAVLWILGGSPPFVPLSLCPLPPLLIQVKEGVRMRVPEWRGLESV